MNKNNDRSFGEIGDMMHLAWNAFHIYRRMPLTRRAQFLRTIASELNKVRDEVIAIACEETHLTNEKLQDDFSRTIFQLKSYANASENGHWMNIRISTATSTNKGTVAEDIRKMMVPLGPVVVFGAANLPFAYSTLGSDTSSAFAAGCPVIVKAHPHHLETSELLASVVLKAAQDCYMPAGIFSHIIDNSDEMSNLLVEHPFTKAIAFTGSYSVGKKLYDRVMQQRKEPIPFMAEMSATNPIFLLPDKMKTASEELAKQCVTSFLDAVGQYCTNPGIIIGVGNCDLKKFLDVFAEEVKQAEPGVMLNFPTYKNFVEKRANAIAQPGISLLAVAEKEAAISEATPTITTIDASSFIENSILQQEIFGPFTIVISCKDVGEMLEVATHLEGQLTATIMATEKDIKENDELIDTLKNLCGRFILNSVPTGLRVCQAQHHGGPFPSTTDSRFSSVGADAISRFSKPLCFQNWTNSFLPLELQNENPLNMWRQVNDEWTKDAVL